MSQDSFFMKDICVGLWKKTVPAYKARYKKNVIFLEISIVFSEKNEKFLKID